MNVERNAETMQTPEGLPVWEYLDTLDLPKETIEGLGYFVSEENIWVGPKMNFGELLDMDQNGEPQVLESPSPAMEEIGYALLALYGCVQPVLDRSHEQLGFVNEHGLDHVRRVSLEAGNLLVEALRSGKQVDWQEITAARIAGMLHDLGGAFSGRTNHHASSVCLTELLFEQEKIPVTYRHYFDLVQKAILHHYIDLVDRIDFERLPAASLALLITDKIDVGIHRVNELAAQIENVLDKDQHTSTNFYINEYGFLVDHEEKEAIWQLDFSLNLQDEREGLKHLSKQSKGKSNRKLRDGEMIRNYKENGSQFAKTYLGELLEIHPDRIFTAMRAVFALFDEDKINEFVLRINDTEDPNYQKVIELRFERQEVLEFANEYRAEEDKSARRNKLNWFMKEKLAVL